MHVDLRAFSAADGSGVQAGVDKISQNNKSGIANTCKNDKNGIG